MKTITLTDDQKAAIKPVENGIPVRNLLVIGGLDIFAAKGYNFEKNDDRFLKTSFGLVAGLGYDIAPDVKVTNMNLKDGANFLERQPEADAVLFANIFYDPDFYKTWGSGTRFGSTVLQAKESFLEQSWHNALLATGASVAINVHKDGVNELPTPLLDKSPFRMIGTHQSDHSDSPKDGNFIYDILRAGGP